MFLFVLLIALTALGLVLHMGMDEYNDELNRSKLDSARLAFNIASEFRVLVNSAQELGETLALLPDVQNGNTSVIEPLLAKFIVQNPVYANIVLMDHTGIPWASGIPLQNQKYSMSDRRYFKDVLATGRFSAGEYTMGKTTSKPVLSFGYPLNDANRKISGCIAIGFNLEYFRNIFDHSVLHAKATFLLLDHQGIILYTTQSPEKFTGKPYPFADEFKSIREGVMEKTWTATDVEGLPIIITSSKLILRPGEAPYLYILSTIPYENFITHLRIEVIGKILFLASIMLLAIIFMWYIGRRFILNPITTLTEAIMQIANGNLNVRTAGNVNVRELVKVGQALDTMAIQLSANITEHRKTEEQLRQSLKMESVGRLAGGVAHDFNNMLGVILGHTEMILDELDPTVPIYADLMEIRKAAERSADLTRQLLAFARKQTATPKVLNLNDTVDGMLKLLRRLIGEDIDLVWQPENHPCLVKIDPSQIDQIMANLSINARDAITGIGKITIETKGVTFDAEYCAANSGFIPGDYVALAISDDGCGMDKQILNKLFEPFFTTKEIGKGTGLGLATVYGIVKQNNGFITVYSEPGVGTSFRIYLPRYLGESVQLQEDQEAGPAPGNETILLVEDEPLILAMTTTMLERLGYKVLASSTPSKALELAEKHAGKIDLLMTDIIMPEMNGRDLGKRLVTVTPNLRVLFMSGYTANIIAQHDIMEEGSAFLEKPFSKKELAIKLRTVLERK